MRHILIITDSKRYRPLFTALSDLGIRPEQASSVTQSLKAISVNDYAAVILDWDVSSLGQSKTLKEIRDLRADLPVLVLTSGREAEIGGKKQRQHRAVFLTMTGEENNDLIRLLEALKSFLPELGPQLLDMRDLLLINTPSKQMNEVLALVDILKDERSSVLIQGETGTGKEVIARLLHFSGRRYAGAFVAINCAAIPETLLESELFGHERGSFTGATEKRIGKFELAHKGTVFLDEIGDMPLNTQAKILRVLENEEIERVGGHEKIPVDIRILAATNKDLLEQVEKGSFRQDLYYRINTFTLVLPPLRERKEDILPLARHFLEMFVKRRREGAQKRLSQVADELLLRHEWPGNVRELRNAMERAAVLAPSDTVGPEFLPQEITSKRASATFRFEPSQPSLASAATPMPFVPLEEMERRSIIEALSRLGNNATKAARKLGISKATLYRKLRKYGISRQLTLRT